MRVRRRQVNLSGNSLWEVPVDMNVKLCLEGGIS